MAFLAVDAARTLCELAIATPSFVVSHLFTSRAPRIPARHVAVIGSGIAGAGAAYALRKSGIEVSIYEERDVLGGNAKTYAWERYSKDSPYQPSAAGTRECEGTSSTTERLVTGLSVLAWPEAYFRNYSALIRELGIATTEVDLPFYVQGLDGSVFRHDQPVPEVYLPDRAAWARAVGVVRRVNRFFTGAGEVSLYDMAWLNPFNIIPIKWLARLCGVSSGFWRDVVIPIYSSTFLTVNMDAVPAVILPGEFCV
jgi:hypothetical protein